MSDSFTLDELRAVMVGTVGWTSSDDQVLQRYFQKAKKHRVRPLRARVDDASDHSSLLKSRNGNTCRAEAHNPALQDISMIGASGIVPNTSLPPVSSTEIYHSQRMQSTTRAIEQDLFHTNFSVWSLYLLSALKAVQTLVAMVQPLRQHVHNDNSDLLTEYRTPNGNQVRARASTVRGDTATFVNEFANTSDMQAWHQAQLEDLQTENIRLTELNAGLEGEKDDMAKAIASLSLVIWWTKNKNKSGFEASSMEELGHHGARLASVA